MEIIIWVVSVLAIAASLGLLVETCFARKQAKPQKGFVILGAIICLIAILGQIYLSQRNRLKAYYNKEPLPQTREEFLSSVEEIKISDEEVMLITSSEDEYVLYR